MIFSQWVNRGLKQLKQEKQDEEIIKRKKKNGKNYEEHIAVALYVFNKFFYRMIDGYGKLSLQGYDVIL